jgi:surfactin synthase thioesterase subunit
MQGDLDIDLAVEQLFTTPSIRDLAIAIDQLLDGAGPVEVSETPANWIIRPSPRADAQVRLFCFPFAGGGASAFKPWANALPDHFELCVIQMPGREERLAEPLMTDMSELVTALTQEIAPLTDRPFAFFGHSMGAIVAYEVACRLRDTGAGQLSRLFLSARAAPQLQQDGTPLRHLDDEAFIERLQKVYGAVPEAIRQSAELRDIFLPILRADVALLETHADTRPEPLPCPITALGGANDPAISAGMLAGWQDRTSAGFAQCEFPGDHFYVNSERDAVIAAILDALKDAL